MFANVLDRFRALVLSLLLIAAVASPALAGPFEDAIGKFANDEFSDTDEAIGAVATSGNPLAFAIISALQDGRLMADPDSKKVQHQMDILNGKVSAPPAKPVKKVK